MIKKSLAPSSSPSLRRYLTIQILRWTGLGIAFSALVSACVVLYFGVVASEHQLETLSLAAAKAFRPAIVSGNIKNAQEQMREAFRLGSSESIRVRDPQFELFYRLGTESQREVSHPSCGEPKKICWNLREGRISTLYPVYFYQSEKTEDLFGYLDVSLSPSFNLGLLTFLFLVICAGFVIQSLGIAAKTIATQRFIGERIFGWANHLNNHPKEILASEAVPFEELEPMQSALAGLRHEIGRLEHEASQSAKLSVIRGIAHDILSPVSQLQKWMAVLNFELKQTADRGVSIDEEVLEGIQRSLGKLTAMAQRTKVMRENSDSLPPALPHCDLRQELELLAGELKREDEVLSKGLRIEFDSNKGSTPSVTISPGDCQRIFDNLARNAIHASRSGGLIEFKIETTDHGLLARVRDQGYGIAPEIQDKIFEWDFTTRPGAGTGLGLPIVKELCDKNGAKLEFSSELGQGTEFRVLLKPFQEGAYS